jgi:hypothetical protein
VIPVAQQEEPLMEWRPARLYFEESMAEALATKAARPREAAARPAYPALAAVALSLCLPACQTAGSLPAPFEDASVAGDALKLSHLRDAGASPDSESEAHATLDASWEDGT